MSIGSEQRPPHYEGQHGEIRLRKALHPASWLVMKEFAAVMGKKETTIQDPYDVKIVLGSREGRELIKNDGTKTYVVHSTTTVQLEDILEHGLKFRGKWGKPEVPDLHYTGLMLAGPRERMATERNIHYLAFRHGELYKNIKLIYELDGENPGTSQKSDPFTDTFLGHADGTNIEELSAEGQGLYRIPPERLKGYFDLQEGVYIPNPNFTPIGPDLASAQR